MSARTLPALANCCPAHRAASIETLELVLLNDAIETATRYRRSGWPEETAREDLASYVSWLVKPLVDAMILGFQIGLESPIECNACGSEISQGRCWGCGVPS